jgi:DNA repair protein RadA/Sms
MASWMNEVWGDQVPIAGTHYIYSAPGAGKSSLTLTMGIDLALQGVRSLFILTERTEEAVRSHFDRLLLSIPKSKHGRIWDLVTFTDRIQNLKSLPDFLLGVLSSGSISERPAFVVLDSVNGDGVHPCSRSYEGLYAALRIARASGITFVALGHVTKTGQNSGPQTIAHSVDTVSLIRIGWRRRYFQVLKNRFAPTKAEPTVLEMDSHGCFRISPHARSSAATVRTFGSGSPVGAEIQVSVSIPAIGKAPKILCPGLPKGHVTQLLQSLERHPDLGLPISYFNLDIQLLAESCFQKIMHFPVAVGALASLEQFQIPQKCYFVGEMDLNHRLRDLSLGIRNAMIEALQSQELPSGATILCPASDANVIGEASGEVRVLGVGTFLEFVDMARNAKENFLRKAA